MLIPAKVHTMLCYCSKLDIRQFKVDVASVSQLLFLECFFQLLCLIDGFCRSSLLVSPCSVWRLPSIFRGAQRQHNMKFRVLSAQVFWILKPYPELSCAQMGASAPSQPWRRIKIGAPTAYHSHQSHHPAFPALSVEVLVLATMAFMVAICQQKASW